MSAVFISYTSQDLMYADHLYTALSAKGIPVWFAPAAITSGENFCGEIGRALQSTSEDDEDPKVSLQKAENIEACDIFVFLLSANSMRSVWCKKEIKLAIKKEKNIHVLQLDHTPLSPEFEYLFADIQMTDAYHLPGHVIGTLAEKILAQIGETLPKYGDPLAARFLQAADLNITAVAQGDPSYEDGKTLSTSVTPLTFYLAPPFDRLTETERKWVADNGSFAAADVVLDTTLADVAAKCGIPDLEARITESRYKVIFDFLHQQNGCYFNNKKYGVAGIHPFARTQDDLEVPTLSLELYTTDYYTHRVMKDVCKTLSAENHPFFGRNLSFTDFHPFRVLFTSLGINLLLFDKQQQHLANVLLTRRSPNSAETYGQCLHSLSVVEGVSLSDYDGYRGCVSLTTAAERGLIEELGVVPEWLARDSIRFPELFVNLSNLELGIACTATLKDGLTLARDVLDLRGKDQTLEIADKLLLPVTELRAYLLRQAHTFLPQAAYTAGVFLASIGTPVLRGNTAVRGKEECFLLGKNGTEICGDRYVKSEHFYAVIDGATPKDRTHIDGVPSDVFVASFLADEIAKLPADIAAPQALGILATALAARIPGPEQRPQASLVIYSRARHEIWSYGDCKFAVNGVIHENCKPIDTLLAETRALYLQTELLLGKTKEELQENDTGRAYILPLLKRQSLLCNLAHPYGYAVLNGDAIREREIRVVAVKEGDHVVLASDGYPLLAPTLSESEQALSDICENDPLCIRLYPQTKGIYKGNVSFDDRTYLSFLVR